MALRAPEQPESTALGRAVEVSGPPWEPLPASAHLLEPLWAWAEHEPDRPVAGRRTDTGLEWVSAREFATRIRDLAKGLIAGGVAPGDRVAVMSRTRLEWPQVDYAILSAGGVTVPIYETSSVEQVRWILADSAAVAAVVETEEMRAVWRQAVTADSACREVLVIDAGGLDDLAERGRRVADAAVDERVAALTAATIASIVYTSGTTGRAKGCTVTHGNFRANVNQSIVTLRHMLRDGEETTLLFLPLAHSLARIIWLVCFEQGIQTVFAPDPNRLVEDLPVAQPTMVVAVPRVFDKVYSRARQKAAAEGKAKPFDKSAEVAIRWAKARASGRGPGVLLSLEHALFDRLVYRKLRAVFGGRLRFAVSGGGPLGERLTYFFSGVGIDVYEGYGLTETSPVLAVNAEGAWRPGTVGRPMPGTTIRIAADGEILAKGPQVFAGYWANETATAEVFDPDGWFRTGDIGEFDADGYVRITGRKKDLIVTAAGKNVAPAPLEDAVRSHPLVSEAVVIGEGRPFVAALIALDEETLAAWAAEHGLPGDDVAELRDDPKILAGVQDAVDGANALVSRAESIRKFAVLPHDLSIESGELTPTLKVRRAVVEETFSDLIAALYAG